MVTKAGLKKVRKSVKGGRVRSYWVKSAPKAAPPKRMKSAHKPLTRKELWGMRIGGAIGAGLGVASFDHHARKHRFANRNEAEASAYARVGAGLTGGATLGYFVGRYLDRRAARKRG